jgi:hypothetical protein
MQRCDARQLRDDIVGRSGCDAGDPLVSDRRRIPIGTRVTL